MYSTFNLALKETIFSGKLLLLASQLSTWLILFLPMGFPRHQGSSTQLDLWLCWTPMGYCQTNISFMEAAFETHLFFFVFFLIVWIKYKHNEIHALLHWIVRVLVRLKIMHRILILLCFVLIICQTNAYKTYLKLTSHQILFTHNLFSVTLSFWHFAQSKPLILLFSV